MNQSSTVSRAFAGPAKVLAIGCGAVVLVGVLALIALAIWMKEPTGVEVSVDAPIQVTVGERFTIAALVENVSDEPQTLVDLDIAGSYLEGVAVERTDPAFSDAMHLPLDNSVSYSFDIAIPTGGELAVTLHVYAAHTGDYSGDIDFCINSAVACLSYPVRTLVTKSTQ
jgi:hypothetical protein